MPTRTAVQLRRLLLCAALAMGAASCDQPSAPDQPAHTENLSVFRVAFSRPVALPDAFATVQKHGLDLLQIEHAFPLGNDQATGFYTPGGDASPRATAEGLRDAHRTFLADLAQNAAAGSVEPAQLDDARAALRNREEEEIRVTGLVLLGPSRAATGLEDAPSVRRVDMQAGTAPASSFSAPMPTLAAATAYSNEQWVPQKGHVSTGQSSVGTDRFVYQEFVFDNVSAYAGNRTYEHEFYLNEDPKSDLGPGVYLDRIELVGRYPRTTYTATNLPMPYLDTRFLDPNYEISYTIGSSNASALVRGQSYWTYIRTRKGTADRDNAKVQAQIGHRVPESCHASWCSFKIQPPVRLTPGLWPVPVPGTTAWKR